jgi:hypothetical protein
VFRLVKVGLLWIKLHVQLLLLHLLCCHQVGGLCT